jgi:ribosomal protein S18 acetylase RimI-like enzyme
MATEESSFQMLDDDRREIVAKALFEAFEEDFGRRGVSRESAKSFFEQNFRAHNELLTIWEGGELAATAAYVRTDKFYISNVYVSPGVRGRGFARMAVAAAEKALAENHDPKTASLWCEKDLVAMYEKLGYAKKVSNFQVSRDKFVEIMERPLAVHSTA